MAVGMAGVAGELAVEGDARIVEQPLAASGLGQLARALQVDPPDRLPARRCR